MFPFSHLHQKDDQKGQAFHEECAQQRQDEAQPMLAVALGVTLLVEDASGAKEQDGPEGLPRKQPADGTDRR